MLVIKTALFAASTAAQMRDEGDVGRERPPLPPPGSGPGPAPTGVAPRPILSGRSRTRASFTAVFNGESCDRYELRSTLHRR